MIKISVFVRNEEQLKLVLNYPIEMIYTDNLELVHQYKELYYQVPRVPNQIKLPHNLLVGDIGTIYKNQHKNMVSDYFFNVANSKTIQVLLALKVKKINLSLELNRSFIKQIPHLDKLPLEVLIYSRSEDMLLKRHPLFTKNGYEIEDYEKRRYPVVVSESGVHIFHYKVRNDIDKISEYYALGISSFRVDFFDETSDEIRAILEKLFSVK